MNLNENGLMHFLWITLCVCLDALLNVRMIGILRWDIDECKINILPYFVLCEHCLFLLKKIIY